MLVVRPYDSAILNNLNILNEVFSLFASYLLLELQDGHYSPDDMLTIGEATHDLFIAWAAINIIIILGAAIFSLVVMLKQWYQKRRKLKQKVTIELSKQPLQKLRHMISEDNEQSRD